MEKVHCFRNHVCKIKHNVLELTMDFKMTMKRVIMISMSRIVFMRILTFFRYRFKKLNSIITTMGI